MHLIQEKVGAIGTLNPMPSLPEGTDIGSFVFCPPNASGGFMYSVHFLSKQHLSTIKKGFETACLLLTASFASLVTFVLLAFLCPSTI